MTDVDEVTLLARASMYHTLAVGYDYPGEGHAGRVDHALARSAPLAEQLGAPWPDLVSGLAEAARGSPRDALEADFNRLFAGSVECSPHETAYEPDIFRRQRALADLVGFYRAFGLDLPQEARWQPDHLGVELDFVAILLQRHAQALEHGWEEPATVCDDAARSFLNDHLGRWGEAFGERLGRLATTPLYGTLAAVTVLWIRRELDALGVAPVPLAPRPRALPDDDESPACGTCPVASG